MNKLKFFAALANIKLEDVQEPRGEPPEGETQIGILPESLRRLCGYIAKIKEDLKQLVQKHQEENLVANAELQRSDLEGKATPQHCADFCRKQVKSMMAQTEEHMQLQCKEGLASNAFESLLRHEFEIWEEGSIKICKGWVVTFTPAPKIHRRFISSLTECLIGSLFQPKEVEGLGETDESPAEPEEEVGYGEPDKSPTEPKEGPGSGDPDGSD